MGYPLRWNSIRTQQLPAHPQTGGKFGAHARGAAAHWGWDLTASPGTPVFAVGPGEIVKVLSDVPGYGTIIQLKFLRGSTYYFALYAHLSRPLCKVGDRVSEAQILGFTGLSGNARGEPPHLHFEVASSADLRKKRTNHLDPATILGAFLRDNESGTARVTESSYPICLTPEQIERAELKGRTA